MQQGLSHRMPPVGSDEACRVHAFEPNAFRTQVSRRRVDDVRERNPAQAGFSLMEEHQSRRVQVKHPSQLRQIGTSTVR